jgi:hypothetical protein
MSYPVQPSSAVPAPAPAQPQPQPSGPPSAVTAASALLWVMAAGGLIYAVITLAVVPGVVHRFRSGVAGSNDLDTYVAVIWLGAAVALAVAVILFALYVVLALGLRRGSNAARIGAWVVSGLGMLAGAGSAVAVIVQRRGVQTPGTLGTALADAYPSGWIGLNVALALAQVVAYVVVAVLLAVSPGGFFRRPVVAGPGYAWPAG